MSMEGNVGGPTAGSRVLRLVDEWIWVPVAAIFLWYIIEQARLFHAQIGHWDFLLLSGWATLAAGLFLTNGIPPRLERTLRRLRDRGAIDLSDDGLETLMDGVARRATPWGAIAAGVAALGIIASFAAAGRADLGDGLFWLEALGGLVAGFKLGRIASYGSLGSLLRRQRCKITVTPGHVDGAGGLKPVGDFYFFQAMVAGIPAAFLAVWWMIIPVVPRPYQRWRNPYLGLLVLAVAVELLAFFVPLWFFHREMERQKDTRLAEADRLSSELAKLEAVLSKGEPGPDAQAAKARLAGGKEWYLLIEGMPTWPLDPGTRRRFRGRNLILLVPLATKVVGASGPWKQIADALSRVGN